MPGIADKFTQSAQNRLLWPGMTRRKTRRPGAIPAFFCFALRNSVYRRHHSRKRMIKYSAGSRFHLWRRRLLDARIRGHDDVG
ncbi:MAG TPA: hypothetical protein VK577_08150, partial [Bradyrhizobium sp.]|nr:hypothetical protein [Bradyrhizobium sp.]